MENEYIPIMRGVRTAMLGSLLCIFMIFICAGSVSAADASTGQLIVTGYDLDPKVFYPGDTGILTIKLKNSGTSSVVVDKPTLLGGDFLFLNDKTMVPVGTLGGGGETSVTLQIKPSGTITSGMAYPYFSVSYTQEGGGSTSAPVRVQIPIQIDDTDLSIQITEKPNMVSAGSMGSYKLRIGNPRNYQITSLSLTIGGEGITTRQEGFFLGTITANNYTDITIDLAVSGSSGYRDYSSSSTTDYSSYSNSDSFKLATTEMAAEESYVSALTVRGGDVSVLPMPGGSSGGINIGGGSSSGSSGGSGDAILIVTADYKNGQNSHTSVIEIPITASGSSSVVISDLIATKYEDKYTVTGTVYNPSLRDISSVIVVAGQPAIPQGSYQAALGVVEGNDYGEFELTFTVRGEPSTIPIIVTYQDELGMYHQEQNSVSIIDYDLAEIAQPTQQASVLIPAIVVVGAAAAGCILRNKKE